MDFFIGGIMKLACKHVVDNTAYYYEKKEHLDTALNGFSTSLMMLASIAIHRDTNAILKCRYPLEYILDTTLEKVKEDEF
jgi:hypothetical protein